MEDSAKRRARLQAMRVEASSVSTEVVSPLSSSSTPLSNPLAPSSVSSLESRLSPHRFDYYTDPAAAYSAVKRKTNDKGGDAGHGGHFHPPKFSSPIRSASPMTYTQPMVGQNMDNHTRPFCSSHAHHFPSPNQSFYGTLRTGPGSGDRGAHAPQAPSPNQSSCNTPVPRFQTASLRSPVQYPSPASRDRGAYAPQDPSPNESFYNTPFPRHQTSLLGSPVQYQSPASADRGTYHNFSRPWNMSGTSLEHNFTPNSSNFGSSSTYSGIRGSPHTHSGGRDRSFRVRGGYHSFGRQADKFASKSMVKDPWRKLRPVVGNILVPLSEVRSWLPTSIAEKKVEVSETSTITKPKQNLAEFLALAFEEAVSDAQEGEGSIMSNPNNAD